MNSEISDGEPCPNLWADWDMAPCLGNSNFLIFPSCCNIDFAVPLATRGTCARTHNKGFEEHIMNLTSDDEL